MFYPNPQLDDKHNPLLSCRTTVTDNFAQAGSMSDTDVFSASINSKAINIPIQPSPKIKIQTPKHTP